MQVIIRARLHYEAQNENINFDFDFGIIWASEDYQSKFFSANQEFVTTDLLYKSRSDYWVIDYHRP